MSFAKNLRILIQQSFLSLPLLFIGWSLFLGSLQGNIGLLVLFLGHLTVVPLASLLSNTLFEFIFKKMDSGTSSLLSYIQAANADVCNLVPGKTEYANPFIGVAPSLWMGHIFFFFSFLLTNGYFVYQMKAADTAEPEKVERRKTQALLSMILTASLLVVLVLLRKLLVGCETWTGILIGAVTMIPLGMGWYQLARECSARDSDIFGIVQKVLPASAQEPPPTTCVYTGAK
jgi:accessory gene regulator protein AgrB